MSKIYVYSATCNDFTNFGLVGALTPTSCVFEEVANGMSEITLEHPIDALGRYTQLATNNLLMVEVPVRTTPEIEEGNIVTSVEKWTVSTTASKANRTIYKKRQAEKDVKIKVIPGGTKVTMVKHYASGRSKIKSRYGTGWIEGAGLVYSETPNEIDNNSQSIESVEPAWTVKPQIFRIYSVEKGIDSVTVMARHISYDLLYNLTTYKTADPKPCTEALAGIMNGCISDHDFDAYTNLATVRTGMNWTRTNPIDAILNPDNGLTTRYGASLVRDNWELYVLHDPGMNRGVTIEYGKNMTGITYTESFDSVVTRIIPVGETKSGKPLLLDKVYVDDPNTITDVYGNEIRIMDTYPVIYTQELICENCTVGKDVDTVAKAHTEMEKQANALFAAGCDLPTVEMSVEFINLGDTAEYAQYKDLERLFLWDYVTVRHKLHGINVTARIVSIRWNCLLDRMEGMDIGSVGKTLANSGITSWQIPTGISGSKIAGGTIGAGALGDGSVSAGHIQDDSVSYVHLQANSVGAKHIQAESINAGKIAAEAITADKIAANAITAGKIDSESVSTEILSATTAHINNLTAEQIKTDELYAALANFAKVSAQNGDFDFATIKTMIANAMNVESVRANLVSITNLIVTSANMLNATIGNLVLKGEDGGYYEIVIGNDGTITALPVEVSDAEAGNNTMEDGRTIVDTIVNADVINGNNIFGEYANIDTIVTGLLEAGKITATEAFMGCATIPTLSATAIKAIGDTLDLSANESISLIVGKQSKTYRQEPDENGNGPADANFGDLWIIPSTGHTFQCSAVASDNVVLPTFELGGEDLDNLYYTPGEGQKGLKMRINDEGELVYEGVPYAFEIDDDGNLKAVSEITWSLVQDDDIIGSIDGVEQNVEALQNSTLKTDEFKRYMRLDVDDGLHIGVIDSNAPEGEPKSELVLDESSLNVKVGGDTYSKFTGNYVQFGDYQIRKSTKGALVFKLAKKEGEGLSALSLR